jgi:ATP-dependent Lon protease
MIPEENTKDLAEIPENVKSGLEIIPVARMDDVLKHALVRMPEPIEWDEVAEEAAAAARAAADKGAEAASRAH